MWESFFGQYPDPSRHKDLESSYLLFLRDWAWFTVAKWADYEPDGAQSRNPTTHTY